MGNETRRGDDARQDWRVGFAPTGFAGIFVFLFRSGGCGTRHHLSSRKGSVFLGFLGKTWDVTRTHFSFAFSVLFFLVIIPPPQEKYKENKKMQCKAEASHVSCEKVGLPSCGACKTADLGGQVWEGRPQRKMPSAGSVEEDIGSFSLARFFSGTTQFASFLGPNILVV
ncbi:hypothetical protein TWF569_010658 [Orbilia oligospora]|uniref:Uncharacterized protein n=1 Tax=Orbilia oligospora TaxID=2813651 RepID=A0A7C8NKT7_ORBOL|nr:hypothetical protein TWF102_008657 [Orbilia oligospora]KAF3100563.1 hypothetical protein TWF706_006120 [Orbilia oligospora]KAF3101396.1 hypothetical protein TWF103_007968 [Orbilia oligospora]KAF3130525.1 hypothetical protein TWF594_010281 [Orbilia oligospora]KAF3155040.1 hypothetical protein TWF569_010658 [Orbilia oligospora]